VAIPADVSKEKRGFGKVVRLPLVGSESFLDVLYSLSATEFARARTISKSFVTKFSVGGELGDIEKQNPPDGFKTDNKSKSEMVLLPNK
jgi:hypothetical protein